MVETSGRHQLMQDALIWSQLAYAACGWLHESGEASLRRFWIDDFRPEGAIDTQQGVDFVGTAWVGEGSRSQHPYRFVVSVPQMILRRHQPRFAIERLVLDEVGHTLHLAIAHPKQVP